MRFGMKPEPKPNRKNIRHELATATNKSTTRDARMLALRITWTISPDNHRNADDEVQALDVARTYMSTYPLTSKYLKGNRAGKLED